jgi:hypothetical protein
MSIDIPTLLLVAAAGLTGAWAGATIGRRRIREIEARSIAASSQTAAHTSRPIARA